MNLSPLLSRYTSFIPLSTPGVFRYLAAMETGDYKFKKLGEKDLDALLEMERLCFSYPWNEQQYSVGIKHGAFHVFGFTGPEGLAAYVSFHVAAGEMEILNIAVKPELRRRGLGSKLLGLVLSIASQLGADKAFLDVRESNVPARALYRGFGFKHVGTRRNYYPDTKEDALTLVLCPIEVRTPRDVPASSKSGH